MGDGGDTLGGSNPNARETVRGRAPIHATSDWRCARALAAAGADLEAVADGDGFTPLQCAAAEGRAEVVSQLLEAGADPRARTPGGLGGVVRGKSAADLAAEFEHPDVVRLLADAKGARTNAANERRAGRAASRGEITRAPPPRGSARRAARRRRWRSSRACSSSPACFWRGACGECRGNSESGANFARKKRRNARRETRRRRKNATRRTPRGGARGVRRRGATHPRVSRARHRGSHQSGGGGESRGTEQTAKGYQRRAQVRARPGTLRRGGRGGVSPGATFPPGRRPHRARARCATGSSPRWLRD